MELAKGEKVRVFYMSFKDLKNKKGINDKKSKIETLEDLAFDFDAGLPGFFLNED